MRRPLNRESDDIDSFYSGLLADSSRPAFQLPESLKRTKLAQRIKSRRQAQKAAERRQQASRTAYQQFVASAKKPDVPSGILSPPQTDVAAVTPKRSWQTVTALLFVSISVIGGVAAGGYAYWRSRQQPVISSSSDLTPETVIVPLGLPEGYSVGSSLQSLENGAKLYTIYSDKGYEITVTQHAKGNNFTQPVITKSISFRTEAGDAFIMQDAGHITGYLFTESNWVLFNSTDGLAPEDLRRLMESFQTER